MNQIKHKYDFNILSNSNIDEPIFGKFPKINFTTFEILLFSNFLFFLFFYFKAIFNSFQNHLNHFDFSIKTTQPIKLNAIACMHQTCCYLIMYFNLMKIFYFPIFHVHKSSLVNHFSSISQRGKF